MWNRLKAILADFIQQADLVLLGLCCAATLYGMVLIASATRYMGADGMIRYVGVQGAAMALGLCAYVFMSMIDVEIVLKKWKWVLAFNIVFIGLLLTPLGVGGATTGNQAWLKIPGIPFQIGPAEIVKITFTLLLAKQLEWLREEKRDLKSFPAAAMVAGHTLLLMGYYVVISGDMGNALTFFFIFLCMAFAAGFALRWFALLFAGLGGGIAFVLLLDIVPASMDYMLNRFRVLFDHSYDSLGVGWQQSRSLLAIGSGGIFGQGYMQGTQTQSSESYSLPYRWTDFIFSVIGEELGFLGCVFLLFLYFVLIYRGLMIAKECKEPFGMLLATGVISMWTFQILVNVGMTCGIMPVTGIPLPFMSYGVSALTTNMVGLGILLSVYMHQQTMIF